MKKLLKAVALVTVLCLALSTAAFAEGEYGTATPNTSADPVTIDVSVVNAGANKQVALLITTSEAELADLSESNILYIDQKQADGEGAVSFPAVKLLANSDATMVDIWVGSEGLQDAKQIGNDVDIEGIKEITLVSVDAQIYDVKGDNEVKAGVAAAITVAVPDGLVVDGVIWSFDVKKADEEVATRRFSERQAGTDATGNVQFAAVFNNGYVRDAVEVSNVGLILLTGEGTEKQMEHFTNDADRTISENKQK